MPWDAALVEIFATLFVIMRDAEGFASGRAAYPDKIELKAPELPAELRGTFVADKYGRAWFWPVGTRP